MVGPRPMSRESGRKRRGPSKLGPYISLDGLTTVRDDLIGPHLVAYPSIIRRL